MKLEDLLKEVPELNNYLKNMPPGAPSPLYHPGVSAWHDHPSERF